MSSIDIKKFGDEISSVVIVTITYFLCITQFPNVVQKCYGVSFFCQ